MICKESVLILFFWVFTLGGCELIPENKVSRKNTIQLYKDIPGVTAEEIASIEALKAKRDKFSYGAPLSTEMFYLPDGTYGGFNVEFCNLLTKLFEIPFIAYEYEWDDLIRKLESHEVDFTGELTPTEERINNKGYLMTLPIAQRQLRIFTLADSREIQSEQNMEGFTIGFLEGTVTAWEIRKIYSTSFKDIEIPEYATAARMLQDGTIDAFIEECVADPAFDEYDFVRSQIVFPMVYSPVSMTTVNSELAPIISVVDKFISYITTQRGDVLFDMYQAGDFAYARNKLVKLLTDEEKAYIQDLKDRNAAVQVASEQDGYPIGFYNKRVKEYQGIAFDVLAEISKLVDIKFEFIHGKDFPWTVTYDKVKVGEIPMIARLAKTKPREEHFVWTLEPYARSFYAIMSKSDFPSLGSFQISRHSIGMLRNSTYTDLYFDLYPGRRGNVKEYDTLDECLDALGRGDVELLMASEYMLLTQTNFREKTGYKILRLPVPMDSHFAFNKNEAILCSIISKAQQFVPIDAINAHWLDRSFDYSRQAAETRTFFMSIFSSVLSLVLAVIIFLLVRTIKLEKKLEDLASKDALTNIFNRRCFMELAAIQMVRISRTNNQCFVVIFDLDHFKVVNDTYGHLAGDNVLKEIAHRVKIALRPYDLLGRYGGEEFILLMSDIKETDALNALERLRLIVCSTPVCFENNQISVSASFGIAKMVPGIDLDVATQFADEALYQAKEDGRNRIAYSKKAEMSEKTLFHYLQSKKTKNPDAKDL